MLEEKERTMGVIKGYVEVNDDVENETMKYLGEVWTERQRNERNRVHVISLKRINVSCHKRTIISESESYHMYVTRLYQLFNRVYY